jgi:SAM-dependent methyltransferase
MYLRLLLSLALCTSTLVAQEERPAGFISFDEVRPLLQLILKYTPLDLEGDEQEQAAAWLDWVQSRDAIIRARLLRGDEDTMINFLLWGVTFTRQPRISKDVWVQWRSAQDLETTEKIINPRINDLIDALGNPGNSRRLNFLRELVLSLGYKFDNQAEKERLRKYLLDSLTRVLLEHATYGRELASLWSKGDANEVKAVFAQLYKDRGLSLDTSLPISFAIEQSLKEMLAKGVLNPAGIKRIAIVGPGLDFLDKDAGYDFYPEQTLQPFAVADSLLKLKLSKASDLEITTFDISPRVNWHLRQMIKGEPRIYTLHLPIDPVDQPNSNLLAYWNLMGSQIGNPSKPLPLPDALSGLKIRAVRVRPEIITRIRPLELNIVFQKLDLPETEKFDLIIATNVLIYYNLLEQSLALSNIEKILKPGGVFLCNTDLWTPPGFRIRFVGNTLAEAFSRSFRKGDIIYWYQFK